MAIAQNIEIDQSSDYLKQFTAKDDTGTVIDLTGSTITSQVRKSYGTTTVAATFTPVIVSAIAGTFTLALTDAHTAVGTLAPGRHVYDVIVTDAGGDKTRIQEGIAVVSPSVTR